MDVRFINPFIGAVKHVFKTMLTADVMVSKPVVKEGNTRQADVSAIIGLSGDAVGCVVLCFSMAAAEKVASAFASAPMTKDDEDFSDALGELANMVAGQAKAQFGDLQCNISLPSVIIGSEHVVSQSRHTPRLAIPCDSTVGRFAVEVAMVVTRKEEARAQGVAAVGASN